MRNYEQHLNIQAYLDGELAPAEAKQVEQWLAADASAKQLLAELQATKTALRENEPAVKLPVTREFYWNQIQRIIEKAEATATRQREVVLPAWLIAWRRWLMPVASLAMIALLAVIGGKFFAEDPARHYVEIENLSDEVITSTFRFQSEKMFVVWISTKETASANEIESDGEEAYQ